MTKVCVAYQSEREVDAWIAGHDRGDLPGHWPYGFDALDRPGLDVTWIELEPRPRWARATGQLSEAVGLRPVPRSQDVLVTWDEGAAVRAVGRRRGRAHLSGVIWLTDRPDGVSDAKLRAMLSRCAGLWVLSRGQLEPLRQLIGSACPPLHFIRFGIDTEFYAPVPYPERPLILSAGGDRDRDLSTLFAALAIVHKRFPDAEILVQGRAQLSAPAGVTMYESMPHTQLRDLYGRMSVMVLATRPNLHVSGMTVALEAMATGRPCIITDSPGMDDYVLDNEGGYVVPRDPAAIAARVCELLADHEHARDMGRRGADRVRQLHTQSTMADQFADVIRSVSG